MQCKTGVLRHHRTVRKRQNFAVSLPATVNVFAKRREFRKPRQAVFGGHRTCGTGAVINWRVKFTPQAVITAAFQKNEFNKRGERTWNDTLINGAVVSAIAQMR